MNTPRDIDEIQAAIDLAQMTHGWGGRVVIDSSVLAELVRMATEAVTEHKERIEELENRIAELEDELREKKE